MGWKLKFISGKYQGGEFPLEDNSEIYMGRSSDLGMVLVEDMVSRKHARITTYNSTIQIEDLGSTNGSFVNGEKITQCHLEEGDRILIGTSIIKVVFEDPGGKREGPRLLDPIAIPEPAMKPYAITNTTSSSTGMTTVGVGIGQGAISGLLEEVPIADILQLLSSSKKTGVLIINSQSEGRVYLREGRCYFADIDSAPEFDPYKAFYRMLTWSKGTFQLDSSITDQQFNNEIDESTEGLLMEGMRLIDEIRNLKGVPDSMDTLEVPQPLIPPLRHLTPELLDTLQLIHNFRVTQKVLDNSLASDLETCQDILYLLQNEYVGVV